MSLRFLKLGIAPHVTMDTKLDRVLHDLRILARIPRNGRIRKSHMGRVTLETDDYLVSLRRRYNQDSREQAIKDISSIFNDAFAEIHSILSHKYMIQQQAQVLQPQVLQPQVLPQQFQPQYPSPQVPLSQSPNLFDGEEYQPKTQPIPIPQQTQMYHWPAPPLRTGASSVGSEHEDERRRLLNGLATIYKDLTSAIEGVGEGKGILALKTSTYSNDIAMVTHLDRLIERAQFMLKEIRSKIPEEILTQFSVSPTHDPVLDQL